ncbi:uracil-DNA glycosylase superfamily protein [Pseudogulbenkiania sp. NH8B]|uniref:uracil-DNA glycosylase family protein n=1 Tax=Pseudogulbenkiania sp. (strain NH8B) TaxID=748280 RepID=UPI0002279B23|nr:uracil-DNA glycosylase family protein [Pseudogulbenkiania sp. NH8B]BAK76381.1 uracil-DNA glycosylase superfamily protein [Pseudogulbenkiania sp. NH8B]
MNDHGLDTLLAEIRACRHCEAQLPLGPRPVVQAAATARILLVGQAPGVRVHQTGLPFNDPSGDRLRRWLDLDRDAFYDPTRLAIVPMGFCYPGKQGSGDAPPRPECAALWRQHLLAQLPDIRLTLLIGQYAQAWHLGKRRKKTLTDTVKAWREYQPDFFVLPHPSPRNVRWFASNPWFDDEVVPALRAAVHAALAN